MDDGGAAEISLEFYSNPAPDSVVWNVVGTESIQISAGSENERSLALRDNKSFIPDEV